MYVSGDPEDYGKIRVLELPQGVTINGPVQASAAIESNATVSQQLSLLSRGGSKVVPANLLTLPVADGLIYVQPYYVQSTGAQGYPDVAVGGGRVWRSGGLRQHACRRVDQAVRQWGGRLVDPQRQW